MHSQRNTSQALQEGLVLEHLICAESLEVSGILFHALQLHELIALTLRFRQLLQFIFSRASLEYRRVAGNFEIGSVPAGCCWAAVLLLPAGVGNDMAGRTYVPTQTVGAGEIDKN